MFLGAALGFSYMDHESGGGGGGVCRVWDGVGGAV